MRQTPFSSKSLRYKFVRLSSATVLCKSIRTPAAAYCRGFFAAMPLCALNLPCVGRIFSNPLEILPFAKSGGYAPPNLPCVTSSLPQLICKPCALRSREINRFIVLSEGRLYAKRPRPPQKKIPLRQFLKAVTGRAGK